jgi:hypothetical protein
MNANSSDNGSVGADGADIGTGNTVNGVLIVTIVVEKIDLDI